MLQAHLPNIWKQFSNRKRQSKTNRFQDEECDINKKTSSKAT